MRKISAEIIADSIDARGNRITSFILTYPRFIHSELMTHRMFSRNSASSRAIPFEKMVQSVQEDPFIPIAWQKNHKGMQGSEYLTDLQDIERAKHRWLLSRNYAIEQAEVLNKGVEVTKQLCNRLLEPFLWHTVLVTATEFDNFFELRCPKYQDPSGNIFKSKKDYRNNSKWSCWEGNEDSIIEWLECSKSTAEIHIQALAEAMWDAYHESTPTRLKEGEWHIPFGDKFDKKEIDKFAWITNKERNLSPVATEIAIAVARCARLSYMTFNGEIDYKKDVDLHDQLLQSHHMSPFEHVARCMSDEEYYSFIKGEYPTTKDEWGIVNYERYPYIFKDTFEEDGPIGINPSNPDIYGWCNNFRGFIPYRYLIESKHGRL